MTLYIDPYNSDLEVEIQALDPTPGYCVFVDIAGSTQMKDQSLQHWIQSIHNAFANVLTFMPTGTFPIKCLGDAFMYFIPKALFSRTRETPLQLFASLASIVDEPNPLFPEQKAAVVSGSAYEISFIHNQADVYGKDVDLTARMLSIARNREVMMNQVFYQEILTDYQHLGSGAGFEEVDRIINIGPQSFGGFTTTVEVFVYGRKP